MDNPMRYQSDGQWLPAAEIVRLLATPRVVPNPTPQPTVPRLPRENDLTQAIGLISDASMAKIVATPIFEGFIAAVKGGDRDATLRLIVAGKKSGTITQAEHDALMGLFAGTEPDPAWPATIAIPPPVEVVSEADVIAALAEIGG